MNINMKFVKLWQYYQSLLKFAKYVVVPIKLRKYNYCNFLPFCSFKITSFGALVVLRITECQNKMGFDIKILFFGMKLNLLRV